MNKNTTRFYKNQDDRLEIIKNNPELQLRIIQHCYPEAKTKGAFKTHEEITPSSHLKLDGTTYWLKNFGTDEKAQDAINIAQTQLGLNLKDTLDYIYSNILIEYTPNKPILISVPYSDWDKKIFALSQNNKTKATQYLESRSVDTSTLHKNSYYQSNNIDGTFKGVVFIDSTKTLINTKIESGNYYNEGALDNAIYDALYNKSDDTIFLVEGCINALSMQNYSVLGFFSAANNYSDYIKIEPYITDKRIVLAFDNDEAGNRMKDRMLNLILENCDDENLKIYCLKFPEKQDANDLLQANLLDDYISSADNYIQLYPQHIENTINTDEDLKLKGYYTENNCYYVASYTKTKNSLLCISNFIFKILYFFPDGSDNSRRIIQLQNKFGESTLIPISSKQLGLDSFKATIRSYGNYSFTGNTNQLDIILEDLFQHESKAFEINTLGQHKQFYAFANGILHHNTFQKVNRYGIVSYHNCEYYLPAFSFFNKYSSQYIEEKRFIYKKGNISFNQFSKLLTEAYEENAIIGLLYFISSIFRDIIFEELQFFPYVYLYGDHGVGKTSFTEMLLATMYSNYKGISLEGNSSPKSIARSAHKIKNGLLYLKEYSSKVDKDISGLLKTGYEGVGYSRAQTSNDFKTFDTHFNSAIILDGNTLPSNNSALFSRMIVLHFKQQYFSEAQTKAYQTLQHEKHNGLGKVLTDVLQHRSYFKQSFTKQYQTVYADVKYKLLPGFKERSICHASLLITVYKIFEQKLHIENANKNIVSIILQNIQEHELDLQEINQLHQFWICINYLKTKNLIKENIHYKFSTRIDGFEFIGIKLKILHQLYCEHKDIVEGTLLSERELVRLIQNDPAYIPSWNDENRNTITIRDFGSAYAFDITKLNIDIELWKN